jgi:hypothetical protein
MAFAFTQQWRTFGAALQATWQDFAYANTLSSAASACSSPGAEKYPESSVSSQLLRRFSPTTALQVNLYLWGLISVNLAIL